MQEISPNPSLQKKGTDKVDFAELIPKSVIETIGEQLEVEGEARC